MSKKIMRIAQDGMLYVNRLNEGDSFSISPNFVEIGGELIEGYPFAKPVIDDSLVLWFDGTTGNNYEQTGTWKDLSGNGNDGELMSFGYIEDSGWVDGGLKFDGVDDYVQLPDLDLNPENFTYQLDDKIISFRGDSQAIVKGGEIEYSGRNLLTGTSKEFKKIKIDNWFGVMPNSRFDMGGVLNVGDTVTFRAYIKAPQGRESAVRISEYYSDGSAHRGYMGNLVSDGYSTLTHTIGERNPNVSHIVLNFQNDKPGENSTYDIEYKEEKLEIGNKPTPWTPAPEDITETNIINHTAPFVENNTIHTLRFYNRALTDEEILQNYQAGQCSPLLAMRGDV